jgi:hypothetical protein
MRQITIRFERGPSEQPVGQLTTASGDMIAFTGWLHLIRLLEDELREAPRGMDDEQGASGPP